MLVMLAFAISGTRLHDAPFLTWRLAGLTVSHVAARHQRAGRRNFAFFDYRFRSRAASHTLINIRACVIYASF